MTHVGFFSAKAHRFIGPLLQLLLFLLLLAKDKKVTFRITVFPQPF